MIEVFTIVACICEGGAETAIIDMLVDSDKLVFSREQMLEEEVIRCRSAKEFEERYLRRGFDEKIKILRILDSHSENFKLSKAYMHKIDVINIVTSPEIEMLIILAEGKYNDFKKVASKKKPSEFCIQDLKMKNVKKQSFIKEYFSDINVLISAIHEYKRIKKLNSKEMYLADLLKEY